MSHGFKEFLKLIFLIVLVYIIYVAVVEVPNHKFTAEDFISAPKEKKELYWNQLSKSEQERASQMLMNRIQR